MKKTIIDNELGTIVLTKSNRAKRLTLRVKPTEIAVSLPLFATYNQALAFVQSKRDWILSTKNRLQYSKRTINNDTPLQTLTFMVQLQPGTRKDYFISLKNKVLIVEYPEAASPESESSQEIFRRAIETGLRHEAKRVLPPLLKELATRHGFSYKSVKITSSKGRWGSCSSRGDINLSFYMLLLPEHLVKYVLLHELCHTKEMNHGECFWQLLNSVSDNKAKALARETRDYCIHSIFG